MKKIITILLSLIFIFSLSINSFAGVGDYYTEDTDNRDCSSLASDLGFYKYVDKSSDYKHFSFFFANGYYTIGDLAGSEVFSPNYTLFNVKVPDNSCVYRYKSGSEYKFVTCYLDSKGSFTRNITEYVITSYSMKDGVLSDVNGYFTLSSLNGGTCGIIQTDVPVFSDLDACENYLVNGDLDVSNSVVLPDGYTTESPLTMFVYQSDTNEYDLTLNWTQMDISDDIRSYVTLDIELLFNNTEKKLDTVVIDPAYLTKKDNYVHTNVSTYMEGVKLVNYEDYVEFGFTVYNYPLTGNGLSSKKKHCYVYLTNHGVFYNENKLINAEDIDDKGVKLPTQTEYIQNGGIINMEDWYNSGGSGVGSGNFLGGVFSGFGLLDGSLPAFISSTFSYVPDELWILIFAAVSGALVVGLFKLVVK